LLVFQGVLWCPLETSAPPPHPQRLRYLYEVMGTVEPNSTRHHLLSNLARSRLEYSVKGLEKVRARVDGNGVACELPHPKGEASSVQLGLRASSLICWSGGSRLPIPCLSLRHGLYLCKRPGLYCRWERPEARGRGGDFKAFLAIPVVNGEVFIYKGLWSCWGLDDSAREVRGPTRGT